MNDQTTSSGGTTPQPQQNQPQPVQPPSNQAGQFTGPVQPQPVVNPNPQTNQPQPQPMANPNPQAGQTQGFGAGQSISNSFVPQPPTPPAPPAPPGPPMPPPAEEDTTPANFQIAKHLPAVINVAIPAHALQFDEQYFLHLLAGSISLTKDEKKRIIESMPKLRQSQIDELVRIFEEERRKFAELSAKHVPQLEKLVKQHWAEWQDIELEQKASEKKGQDQAQADQIRKQLGLN